MKNGGLNTTQQYSTKQQIQVFEYIKINFQSFFCMFGLPNKIVGLKKKNNAAIQLMLLLSFIMQKL